LNIEVGRTIGVAGRVDFDTHPIVGVGTRKFLSCWYDVSGDVEEITCPAGRPGRSRPRVQVLRGRV